MNEQEWLASADPEAMLRFVQQDYRPLAVNLGLPHAPLSERKLRLFACAVARRLPKPSKASLEACDLAESWANGGPEPERGHIGWYVLEPDAVQAVLVMLDYVRELHVAERQPDAVTMAALLRDIAGNPFRPVTIRQRLRCSRGHERNGESDMAPLRKGSFAMTLSMCLTCFEEGPPWTRVLRGKPEPWLRWNNGTVVKMAEAIYQERAFDRMPMLADALEDAGCQEQEILEHCRARSRSDVLAAQQSALIGCCERFADRKACDCLACATGPHVRGCWVLDLMTGKE